MNMTEEDHIPTDQQQQILALEAKVRELEATVSKLKAQQTQEHEESDRPQTITHKTTNGHTSNDIQTGERSLSGEDEEASSRRKEIASSEDDLASNNITNQSLTADEIERYSRQLILSNGFGVQGQQALLKSRVLVIGAGGIGSTLLMYLATAGVGHLGIIDFDAVEISNLHRQVIHHSQRVGQNKADSARQTLQGLNPNISYTIHQYPIDHENALELVQAYDCVVDCSDNPRTRYLVNDACVLAQNKPPLISGSAVGLEGQITVYNYQNGPCYRCLYPRPSATGGCRACADAGVFGPVPGLIGILQATETIKVLTKTGSVLNNRLLMYDSMQATFLSIKKPPKRANCPVCGTEPSIRSMSDSRDTLLTAAGPQQKMAATPLLADELNVSCQEYNQMRQSGTPHVLLDVRVPEQYELCNLSESIHIPLERLTGELDRIETISGGKLPIYCLCRRGVASAEATLLLHEAKISRTGIHSVFNIRGGLNAWRESVDPSFPKY